MAEHSFKVGQQVQVVGKNLAGSVAYVGLTNFSSGKWIGVVLDEDKGKNNGTVKGIAYFKCAPNHGLFVRPTQLTTTASGVSEVNDRAPASTKAHPAAGLSAPPEVAAVAGASHVSETSAGITNPGANFLKTTKINQPKQARQQFLSSSSQQELFAATETVVSPAGRTGATVAGALVLGPKRSKTSVSPSESFCCPKRASFVETGFLEILRPQFIPGHPLRSPTTFNMSTALGSCGGEQQQLHQKRQELEVKVAELTDELDDLKRYRVEDKRKLHELEKVKLQNDHLMEFKVQIMEQHSLLQRDLQRCRQELRETSDSRGKYKRELDEVAESIEILTLDKEMAEERAETLQIELELAQERIEELTLDVEILRAEHENNVVTAGSGNCRKGEGVPTAGELKKLEQYNQRLRETVVRLRDVLTQEKQELHKAAKELETKTSEISELKKTKEILSKRIDVMEMHIMDLKDQVDAALGAESMVASLAETKIELEDRVKLLEEEVVELEALEEIHEQLIEGNHELEMDLREEIDALNTTIKTLQYEKDNAVETIYDRDVTIMKFRELVKTLNAQMSLKEAIATGTATSTSEDLSTFSNQEDTQSIDFNQVFSITKACSRAIDTQLSAVDLKLCKAHVEYLLVFMPEDFMLRGSEHDVILVLLLLQRISEKVEIVCNTVNEKFPSSCEFAKNAIFEGFSVHRFAFRSKCLYMLRSIKLVLKQLLFGLNHCDYEVCSHAAIYRGEMEAQEKHIDELLHLLKGDMLDENTPMEAIERTLAFFNTLHTNLICSQGIAELIDEHQLHAALIEVLDAGVDCISTNAGILHTIIRLGDENTESFCAMQFLMENANIFKQRLKKLQRKWSPTGFDVSGFQQQHLRMQQIQVTNDYFGRLINVLTATAKDATRDISANKGDCPAGDVAIDHQRLWRLLAYNCSKLGAEEKQSPVAMIQHCVALLDEQINKVFDFITQNESARNSNKNTMFVRSSVTTLLQRSVEMKQHFEDIKTLKRTVAERDKELKAQKYVAKIKQNDFSEMQVRKEMAERNLLKQQKLHDELLAQIIQQIEKIENDISNKESLITQSLSVVQGKLITLENSYQQLERGVCSSKQTSNLNSDEFSKEIDLLNKCLRRERAEHIKLLANSLKTRVRKFEPLFVPQSCNNSSAKKIEKELQILKNQWILSHIALKPDAHADKSTIKRKSDDLARHIFKTYFRAHPHRAVRSDFGTFGTSEMQQILK